MANSNSIAIFSSFGLFCANRANENEYGDHMHLKFAMLNDSKDSLQATFQSNHKRSTTL